MSNSIRNAKWAMIESGLSIAMPAVSLVLMARLLELSDYGLFGLLWSVIGPLWILIECFFSEHLLLQSDLDKNSSYVRSAYGLTLLFVSGLILLLLILGHFFWMEESLLVFCVLTAGLILPALYCIPQSLAFKSARFKMLSARTLIGRLIALGSGALLAWGGFGVWALVAIQLVNGFVTLMSLVLFREFRVLPRLSVKPFSGHWYFLLKLGLNNALSLFGRRVFILMLAGVASLEAIGAIEMANRIVDMIQSVFSGFAKRISLPIFLRPDLSWSEQEQRYWSMTALVAAVPLSIHVVLIAAWPLVLPGLFGAKWIDAGYLVAFFSIAAAFQSLRFFAYDFANLRGRPGLNLLIQIFSFATFAIAASFVSVHDGLLQIGLWWCGSSVIVVVVSFVVFQWAGLFAQLYRSWRAFVLVVMSCGVAVLVGFYHSLNPSGLLLGVLAAFALHVFFSVLLLRSPWLQIRHAAAT